MDKYVALIEKTLKNLHKILDFVIIIKFPDKILTYTSVKDSVNFMKMATPKKIRSFLDICDKYYYDSISPIINDMDYDIISDYYYKITQKNKSEQIGVTVSNKVKLPVYMGSMDKVKLGQSGLTTFLKKYVNNKFISSKLDGISMLIGKRNGIPSAYTRGDGEYGKDISRFLGSILTNSKSLLSLIENLDSNIYIRGELIISKKDWSTYSYLGSNARNMAMGITNRKKITDDIKICRFVGYEYISGELLTISEQFNKISEYGFYTPYHKLYKSHEINEESLPTILELFKNNSEYEIDGIIIQDDTYYKRNIDKNPKYAKAFKMEKYNQSGVSTIKNIEWNPVKSGVYKPVIVIEPINLADIIIKRVYAYNAKYILDNKLGKGSSVEVIRSGDVIPKIKNIINPQFNIQTDFPKEYIWNDNKIDITLIDPLSNKCVILSQMEYFVKMLKIEFCKKSTLKKMFEIGLMSVKDIISLDSYDVLLKMKNIKNKSAQKIFTSIKNKLINVDISTYLAAIPVYNGISIKRLKLLTDNIPDFYKIDKNILLEKIPNIKGFSKKTANIIIKKIGNCREYIDFYKNIYGAFKEIKIVSHTGIYSGKVFCFSGVRNKILETKIIENGGHIVNSLTKSTTCLVVKDSSLKSSKILRAKKLNINIINYTTFL